MSFDGGDLDLRESLIQRPMPFYSRTWCNLPLLPRKIASDVAAKEELPLDFRNRGTSILILCMLQGKVLWAVFVALCFSVHNWARAPPLLNKGVV